MELAGTVRQPGPLPKPKLRPCPPPPARGKGNHTYHGNINGSWGNTSFLTKLNNEGGHEWTKTFGEGNEAEAVTLQY